MILFLFVHFNFSATFDSFHRLFFEKGTYVFDPSKEIIVNLYPEELFMELGIRISEFAVFASIIFILLGAILLFVQKNERK